MKEKFLKSVVTSKNEAPTKAVLDSFRSSFNEGRNVEWTREEEGFEALFSENGFEKIVKFDIYGNVIEIRTNVKPENLVAPIAEKLKKHGTIMSVIHIENKVFGESFEFIIKDSWKVRHLFITDSEGNVQRHRNFDDLV